MGSGVGRAGELSGPHMSIRYLDVLVLLTALMDLSTSNMLMVLASTGTTAKSGSAVQVGLH